MITREIENEDKEGESQLPDLYCSMNVSCARYRDIHMGKIVKL